MNDQAQMTNAQGRRIWFEEWALGIGHWSFIGHWSLVIGHSLGVIGHSSGAASLAHR